MTSYAYARMHAYAYLPTDNICRQIIIQIVYNEPNGIAPSYLIKMRTTNLNDAQLWKSTGYLLRYVILYVIFGQNQ